MNKVFDEILKEVQDREQLVRFTLNVHEFQAVSDVVFEVSQYFSSLRELKETQGRCLSIEQSLFVEALVSASDKLNFDGCLEELN